MRKYRPVLFGAIICISILSLTALVVFNRYQTHKELEQKSLLNEALNAKSRLENCLNHSIAPAQTLKFLIEQYGLPEDFDSTGKALIQNNQCVSAIQLVENGIVTKVYPIKGNESVIGYNILKDPSRNREAYKVIHANRAYFAGPLRLIQGGVGIVGRVPILIQKKITGFAAVIIKLETLLKTAQIQNTDKNRFTYQLSKINPNTGVMDYFVGQDLQEVSSTKVSVTLPMGDWILAVNSKKPVHIYQFIYTIIMGICAAIGGGLITMYLLTLPKKLELKVKDRTRQLMEQEKLLKLNLRKIEKQNTILMDIAWIQSHKVRAPLARVLGLVSVYKFSENEKDKEEIISHLEKSALELDQIIHEITKLSETLKDENL